MTAVAAITGRELRAYFLTPGGYVVAALFLLLNGVLFVQAFEPGQMATMRPLFAFGMVAFMLLCPAITMRAISDELRQGTIEALLTCPVSPAQVVLGKFAAALGFLALLTVPTALFLVALELYGRPDYGEVAAGYLGLLLAASAFLASGILASTLTANQVVAYLLTAFFWLLVLLVTKNLPQAEVLPVALRDLVGGALVAADPDLRLRDFAIGLIDTSNVVYFVTVSGAMLIGAVMGLEARRWR